MHAYLDNMIDSFVILLGCIMVYVIFKIYNTRKKKSKIRENVNNKPNSNYCSINITKLNNQQQYSPIDLKCINDRKKIMEKIHSKENKEAYIEICKKGPPRDTGFAWCTNDDWGDKKHIDAFIDLKNMVLDYGWDSSGYAMMMRTVQTFICNEERNKDCIKILEKINSKENKDDYIGMFKEGPPKKIGFERCCIYDWKDKKHRNAFKDVEDMVLDYGWSKYYWKNKKVDQILDYGHDSSGYAMMMRAIQDVICEQNPDPINVLN